MQRIIGTILMVGTGLVLALMVAGRVLDDRQAYVLSMAGFPAPQYHTQDPGTHLTLADAGIATTGRWRIRRVDDHYLVPLFAAADATLTDTPPRALLRLQVERLAQRIMPPTRVDDGVRFHAAGRVSHDCASQALTSLGWFDPRVTSLACLDDAPAPPDTLAMTLGLIVLAAPPMVLGAWLRRRGRVSTGAPRRVSGARASSLAKVALILAFVVIVPLAKLADDVPPAVVKHFAGAVPQAGETAAKTAPDVPRLLRHDGVYHDLLSSDDLALEALGKAREGSDWYQRLDKLGLLPNDDVTREAQQLDSRLTLARRPAGLYALRSAHSLIEERIRRGEEAVASRVFVARGYLVWDGVSLTATDAGTLKYVALLHGANRFERGQLAFDSGDVAAWRAGRATELHAIDLDHRLLVSLHGDRMAVRRGPVPPVRLPPP